MGLFRKYLGLFLFAPSVIIILIGYFIVSRNSPIETSFLHSTGSEGNITAGPAFSDYAAPPIEEAAPKPTPLPLAQTATNNPPFVFPYRRVVQDKVTAPSTAQEYAPSAEEEKSPSIPAIPATSDDTNDWNLFSLTPSGFISTSATTRTRTPYEQELFDYGNELGSHIKPFENAHQGMLQALTNFFPESGGFSTDSVAKSAVLSLAKDYSRLGDTIAGVVAVPQEAQIFHNALANSYGEVGRGLATVANTNGEVDMVNAILAYDDNAEKFIRNFLAMADFFSARGIKFSASDQGNVFSLILPQSF